MSKNPLSPAPARRMADIAPFHVMELLTRARQLEAAGRSIIHMEVGEPDFPTPPAVIEAAQAFIRQGQVFYTPALGIPALREAISRFYAERYGVSISPERIAVTAGSSGALLLALAVLLNPGDELLLPDPGYPCNRHFVRTLEGIPRSMAVGPETNYQPTAELVAHHWTEHCKGLLVASPANPTGTLIEPAVMGRLAACVSQRGGALLVDEIYHGLTYGQQEASLGNGSNASTALALSDEVFVINSFSKYFGMTGWRVGWAVAPGWLVEPMERLAQNIFLAAPTPAQHAAVAAFSPASMEILEARRREFEIRRDFLFDAVRNLGFVMNEKPRGAFYIYADAAGFTDDSAGFARELLESAGVAITPGLDFGGNRPERHVRFAYTTALDRLETGVERLRAFLRAGAG